MAFSSTLTSRTCSFSSCGTPPYAPRRMRARGRRGKQCVGVLQASGRETKPKRTASIASIFPSCPPPSTPTTADRGKPSSTMMVGSSDRRSSSTLPTADTRLCAAKVCRPTTCPLNGRDVHVLFIMQLTPVQPSASPRRRMAGSGSHRALIAMALKCRNAVEPSPTPDPAGCPCSV